MTSSLRSLLCYRLPQFLHFLPSFVLITLHAYRSPLNASARAPHSLWSGGARVRGGSPAPWRRAPAPSAPLSPRPLVAGPLGRAPAPCAPPLSGRAALVALLALPCLLRPVRGRGAAAPLPHPLSLRSRPVRLPTSYLSASAIGTADPPHSLRFRPHEKSACRSVNLLTRYVCALPPLDPFFKWRSVATENARK